MGQINARLRSVVDCHFSFWCPGCEEMHMVGKGWTFDGNYEAPTISPSLLVTGGHYSPSWTQGTACWCTYNTEHPEAPSGFKCERCHTFIVGGQIQFLGDCTHALAGTTMPIPPFPPHVCDEPSGEQFQGEKR